MVTLTELIQQTYILLDETADTNIANLESGNDETPDVESDDAVIAWLQEGLAVACRTCLPLFGEGEIASYPVGQVSFRLHELTTDDGSTVWAARAVSYGMSDLTYCLRPHLEQRFPRWKNAAAGTPKFWSPWSSEEVLIYAPPAVSATLSVSGLIIPPPLADTGNACDALSDDEVRRLPRYAAMMAARKSKNPTLNERSVVLAAEWDSWRMERWEKLDIFVRRFHYPSAPSASMPAPPRVIKG